MQKRMIIVLMLIMSILIFVGCGQDVENEVAIEKVIRMATTTSTEDSGLLDVLLPEFQNDTGININVIAVGTGQAIKMGEDGDADLILVHARAAEDKFVADGYGVNRKDVMYNDFLILGPADDPAGIKGEKDVAVAMQKIVSSEAVFVSRGDDSGTHKKEIDIWKAANIEPSGKWYKETGQGMGETYRIASEMKAYTLIDRATYLHNRDKYELEGIVEGDDRLFNPYGVIAVNPEKHSNVDYESAMEFVNWITSAKGQKLIGEYGVQEFGQALFVPDAK